MNKPDDLLERARASLGTSSDAIYRMVARVIARRRPGGGILLDVGCGQGELRRHVQTLAGEYVGVDVMRYDRFPADARFVQFDLDAGRIPLPDASADIVVAVETIEHLENPRSFVRELVRLTKPSGLVALTTPNQLSFLSLFSLLIKNQFNAFQEGPGLYPSHLTALLEIDLIRIARECGLDRIETAYSDAGRLPFTARRWPAALGFRGRRFSDNVLLSAHRPGD